MKGRVVYELNSHIDFSHQGRLLFRYVYAPEDAPVESPKPYLHPLRTLAGDEVTAFRPHDYVWHKGLAMTAAHLSGQNFWGGPTYVRGEGYVQLQNNGRIEHRGWERIQSRNGGVTLEERLAWISADEETWISEERRVEANDVKPDEGYWSLDLRFRLENVSGHPLVFGSPTTEGRPAAGYGGLFWRGPRSFGGGEILAAGGLEGPETMGRDASWLAYVGRHDGNLRQSTVLFLDHPCNPRFPGKWFVRNDPYACVSCSFMFDEKYVLETDGVLTLNYRVVLGNGAWPREKLGIHAQAWEAGASRKEMA